GDDRVGVRIPVRDHRAGLDPRAVDDREHGAVRHLVALAVAALVVLDDQLARARDRDVVAARVLDQLDVPQAYHAGSLDLYARDGGDARGGAADVERAHGELGARLADRLRGDHAHGLAQVHQVPAPEVAPVALAAHAVAGFARHRRAHQHLVDVALLEHAHQALVDDGAVGHDDLVLVRGIVDVADDHAPENPVAQRDHDLAALDQRRLGDAGSGAAVLLGHDQVLAHVDQA